MVGFKRQRCLLLSNGVSLGIFTRGLSHVYIIMSEDGSFVHLSDTSLSGGHTATVHLTRFIPLAYKRYAAELLNFRNKHSCKPYCTENFHDENSELFCGDRGVQWRVEPKLSTAKSSWTEVASGYNQSNSTISKLSICPLRQRVRFETIATFFTENVLGTDNLKEELCTLINTEYSYSTCPLDLKSLVEALILPSSPKSNVISKSNNISISNDDNSCTRKNNKSDVTIVVTAVVASNPLGACESSAAMRCFTSLSSDMTLLRDVSKYPCCDGAACTVVEELDGINHVDVAELKSGFYYPGDWNGCKFVICNCSSPPLTCNASKSAAWKLHVQQSIEIQAWLCDERVRLGGVGGVITLLGDLVRFQLYSLTTTGATVEVSCKNIRIDSVENKHIEGEMPHGEMEHLDFTVHLSIFESTLIEDDTCHAGNDENSGLIMPWAKLNFESMRNLAHIDLAAHFKHVIIHLINMRNQALAVAFNGGLSSIDSRQVGIVYGQQNICRQFSKCRPIKITSLSKYDVDMSRQVQFLSSLKVPRRNCGVRNDLDRNGMEQGRCSMAIDFFRDIGQGNCFTQMGDGSTRGVFRKDSLIMEYTPDLRVRILLHCLAYVFNQVLHCMLILGCEVHSQ